MTTRKEIIGDCTLYLGDCLDILPELDGAHHVITDPPYEEQAHAKGRRMLGKQRNGHRTVEYSSLNFEAITELLRIQVPYYSAKICSGWFIAFCQAEAVSAWKSSMEAKSTGIKYKRAMIWMKPDGAPQFTGDRPGMGYESIVAGWCGKGRSKWNGGGRHGVFIHPHRENNRPKDHQTQKPLPLMCELVNLFTNAGEIVLDPFMGSGTTGVACAKLRRKFIGIEVNENSFSTACRRIEATLASDGIFEKLPPQMKQRAFI